ncbi:DNA primase [Chelativorans composti]|uniref:DNA primase n=1 Tax=Chelativorans composti TaxID=768533 RepID=A0ABW5DJK6_9HYPH
MSNISIDELMEELDIEFFLQRESIAYKETRGVNGIQLNIRTCPACSDSRWRVYFGVETGLGNCFVCGLGFNKLRFLHHYFGGQDWKTTMREARELLREQGWRPKRKAMVATFETNVELPVSEELPLPDGSNLAYLEHRGFDAEIARYFRFRWCQFGWWKYKDDDGTVKLQDFSNRLIIPVYDLDGELKTFQGRDLLPPITDEQRALGVQERQRYLFPKMLPGTGRYLYNGHNVVATDHVVMGEGAFDVAAIKVALDEESSLRSVVPVGSFGKHLSYGSPAGDDQLGRFNVLKQRGLKRVTIMWDGEEKVINAALAAARLLAGIGLQVRIALLPHEKDPNEVPAEVVRKAFYAAHEWSPALDIKWRLRNPYSERERAKYGL